MYVLTKIKFKFIIKRKFILEGKKKGKRAGIKGGS